MLEKFTPGGVMVDIIILLFILLLLWKSYKYNRPAKQWKTFFAACLMIVFCVFGFYDTDYYHYKDLIELLSRKSLNTHIEDFHIWLIETLDYSVFWYRITIWGGACMMFYCMVKILKLRLDLSIFIFSMLFLQKFGYGRVSLGWAVAFCGYSIILMRRRWITKIFGIMLIIGSLFMHKSMIFVIAPMAFSFIKFNKKLLFITILSFAIVVYVVSTHGLFHYIETADEEISAVNSALSYGSADAKIRGIGSFLRIILERSVYYLAVILSVFLIIKKQYAKFPYQIRCFVNVSLLIVLFASLFLFNLSANTTIFYYRFLYFAIIPLSVIISYLYYAKVPHSKSVKYIIALGIFASIYDISYKYYLSFFE